MHSQLLLLLKAFTKTEIVIISSITEYWRVKGKAYLYSAFRETSPQGAQVWITQGCPCKLHHTCLYLANIRQMAPPKRQTSDSGSLLIYRPRKDERLSWPSWLTMGVDFYSTLGDHWSRRRGRTPKAWEWRRRRRRGGWVWGVWFPPSPLWSGEGAVPLPQKIFRLRISKWWVLMHSVLFLEFRSICQHLGIRLYY